MGRCMLLRITLLSTHTKSIKLNCLVQKQTIVGFLQAVSSLSFPGKYLLEIYIAHIFQLSNPTLWHDYIGWDMVLGKKRSTCDISRAGADRLPLLADLWINWSKHSPCSKSKRRTLHLPPQFVANEIIITWNHFCHFKWFLWQICDSDCCQL